MKLGTVVEDLGPPAAIIVMVVVLTPLWIGLLVWLGLRLVGWIIE